MNAPLPAQAQPVLDRQVSADELPALADILAAEQRLAPYIVRTPLVESPLLNRRLGFRLLVKAESLQSTGSFKFRGALNKLLQLDAEQRRRGVVAFSSGNHAQGVACAAALLGIPATIVMPKDAPAIKLANTRAYGAHVVTYDRWTESREEIADRLSREQGATTVKPFDDRSIIAGQGTVGLEIAEQAAALGIELDAVVSSASGGGLVAGCALALAARSPRTRVYSAEPEGYDDHARSLEAKRRVANDPKPASICDALMSPAPGELTFAINRHHLAGGAVVSDAEIRAAMRTAFLDLKLVIEPGGAAALAAALTEKLPGTPQTVAVVASGGNVDPMFFSEVLARD